VGKHFGVLSVGRETLSIPSADCHANLRSGFSITTGITPKKSSLTRREQKLREQQKSKNYG